MMRNPAMNTATAGTIQIHGDHFARCTFASGVGAFLRSTSCWSYSLTALVAGCARGAPAGGQVCDFRFFLHTVGNFKNHRPDPTQAVLHISFGSKKRTASISS